MSDRHLFTSECVSMGHPDKVADQISDAVVDAFLAQDPDARVAVETLVTTNLVVLSGEVKTKDDVAVVYEPLVRRTIAEIGYDDPELEFDAATCNLHLHVHEQSPDIAQGVDQASGELGAGDQGLMFGYACDETDERMPLPITLARHILDQQVAQRESGALPWLRPDAKSQVTVEYEGDRAVRIHTVLMSTQHAPGIEQADLRAAAIEEILRPALPADLLDGETIFQGPGLVLVGSVPRYALGLHILRRAIPDDGLLDVCAMACGDRLTLMRHTLKALLGQHDGSDDVVYRQARRVRIVSDERVPVQIDGDTAGWLPVEFEIAPQATRFMVSDVWEMPTPTP